MIQIFQFDQEEVCIALVNHLKNNHGQIFTPRDMEHVDLRTIELDGNTDYINGQVQLIIGVSSDA
jgi:hypothetical protein